MKDPRVVEMLGAIPLFEGLSRKELEAVARIGKEISFPAGKEVVQEGSSGVGFHLLVEGEASVEVGGRTVATLGPRDHFGEMSLLDGSPRSATVRATSELRTYSIPSWDFSTLLDAQPGITRKLLVEMCRRLRAATPAHEH